MPIYSIEELAAWLRPHDVLAGIDLGSKTIGVAVSDRSWKFAHPRPVIARTRFTADAERLFAIIDEDRVAALIVGLPINMDGTEGPRAQATRAFVRNLDRIRPTAVTFWDERLSTVAAERALIGMDVSRQKRSARIDSAAAAFILQGVLDRLRDLKG